MTPGTASAGYIHHLKSDENLTQRRPAPQNIQMWWNAGLHPSVSELLCLEPMLPLVCPAWAPGQPGTAGIMSVRLETES